MASKFKISGKKWKGYMDDVSVADPEILAPPSLNCLISKTGKATTRPGYEDTEVNLNQANKPSRPFHVPQYDITFHAVGTKVYYVDHNVSNAVVDTGITLTDGTHSRFEEYNGTVFVGNITDGWYGFLITRLNGAVTTGDGTIRTDGEGHALAFAYDSELTGNAKNLRINGANEAYTRSTGAAIGGAADNGSGLIRITSTGHGLKTGSKVRISGVTGTTEANGDWTITRIDADTFDLQASAFANAYVSDGTWALIYNGVFVLSGTSSADYDDNSIAIVVYDLTGRFPKCDKIVAWKECLHFVGISPDDEEISSDRRQSVLAFTQFATAATSENILKVSGGTAGSELVGKSGKLVNAVATRDYLYLFKEGEAYYIPVSSVNTSSGARPPVLLSSNYGCLNADSAVDMGNGEVAFITRNNRIIRIRIDSESGAPVVFPDETFDKPYSNTLALMDSDQTDARLYYSGSDRRLLAQIIVDAEQITLPFNNNLEVRAWEPPWQNYFFAGYYEREGITYATALLDDTIYMLGQTLSDNGQDIECVMASPKIEFEDGRVTCKWDQMELSGSMTTNAVITAESVVDSGTPLQKQFDSSGVAFAPAPSLGSVIMGSTTLGDGPLGEEMGTWDKRFAIFPSLGSDLQVILSSNGEGHGFTWDSYSIFVKAMKKSSITLS